MFTYDDLGNLTSTTDPLGNTSYQAYNQQGFLIYSIDAAGGVTMQLNKNNGWKVAEVSAENYTGDFSAADLGDPLANYADDLSALSNMNCRECRWCI